VKYPIAFAAAALVALAAAHNIPQTPTEADRQAAAQILGPLAATVIDAAPATYEDEIDLILAVQDAVLRAAPVHDGIPLGKAREPKDLYEARAGLCYDRSRTIEKLLRLAGFETRHVAVYAVTENENALSALLTPRGQSHAVTEVLTRRGWILVDSNRRWAGLSANGEPVSIAQVAERQAPPDRSDRIPDPIDPIFTADFTFVYGLYSRHGKFYAPYTPIPDVNWAELLDNVTPAFTTSAFAKP